MLVLKTDNLRKLFGHFEAVKNVTMRIDEGDIYGFLGLNGAGKTTTLRMIVSLIKPDYGNIEIFEKILFKNFRYIMSRVGALIELPAYYPHLNAYDNLRILQLMSKVEKSMVNKAIEMVGLTHAMHRKVRTYSQGMRQRLGIASAIVSKPKFVILDEPTNGLDPQGIYDIRKIIMQMNKNEGVTFLISSHLLSEVQAICNKVGIVKNGSMTFEGPLHDIVLKGSCEIRIIANPPDQARKILNSLTDKCEIIEEQNDQFRVKLKGDDSAFINKKLVEANINVESISFDNLSLERFLLSQP